MRDCVVDCACAVSGRCVEREAAWEFEACLPGVRAAAFADFVPGAGQTPEIDNVALPAAPDISKAPMCDISFASPGFFNAIGMTTLRGRDFAWAATDRINLASPLILQVWPDASSAAKTPSALTFASEHLPIIRILKSWES